MRSKLLVIAALLVVIAGLLVVTPVGNGLVGNVELLPGLTSLVDFGSKEHFQMQLVTTKDSFTGYVFEVRNTTLQTTGLCVGYVNAFGANHLKDSRCTILAEGVKGKIEYSSIGTLEVSVEADQLTLDNTLIVPGKDRRVVFTVVPTDLFLSNYDTKTLSLETANGDVRKFKSDGSDDQVKTLIGEGLKVSNYIGNVRLNGNTMVLNGFATKINWFN